MASEHGEHWTHAGRIREAQEQEANATAARELERLGGHAARGEKANPDAFKTSAGICLASALGELQLTREGLREALRWCERELGTGAPFRVEVLLEHLRTLVGGAVGVLPPQVVFRDEQERRVYQALLDAKGATVRHEDLVRAMWAGEAPGAKGLHAVIHRIRAVLGEKKHDHQRLLKVRGKGYRLVPEQPEPARATR